jgi:hypothetical protein
MILLAEPFTDHWVLDIIRCAVGAAALWLAALVVKLMLVRWKDRNSPDEVRTHPATMISYLIALLGIALRRSVQLGDPFDPFLLLAVAILATGYYGVLRRVDVTFKPPWRRARR